MSVGLFYKLFPPPHYLEMRPTGVDISDRSIKFCDLAIAGHGYKVARFGELSLPVGVIESGQIKNKTQLIESLRQFRESQKVTYVSAALPEEQAYIVKLSLPNMPQKSLYQSIELQLEEYVPLPVDQLIFDYEIIQGPSKTHTGYEVAVSVFPKATVMEYLDALTGAGLVPISFEIEAQAVARALVPLQDEGTTLVVDFGRTRTGLFVVRDGQVLVTSTIATIGGELITTAIQKSLGVSYDEAEKMKIERGLLELGGDKRLLYAAVPIISVLRDEVTKLGSYWETHQEEMRHDRRKIHQLVICGGQAFLPGLVEYLGDSLDVPVKLGDIWTNVLDLKNPKAQVPPIKHRDSLKYGTAIGLALKDFVRHD